MRKKAENRVVQLKQRKVTFLMFVYKTKNKKPAAISERVWIYHVLKKIIQLFVVASQATNHRSHN